MDHIGTSNFGNEDNFFSCLTCGSTMDSNCDACDLLVFGTSITIIPIFSKLTKLIEWVFFTRGHVFFIEAKGLNDN